MPFSSQSVSSRGLCWVKISIQMKVKVGLSGSREGLPKVVWQIRVAQTPCLQHAATKKFHGRIAILRLWCAVRLCNSLLRKTLGKRRRFSSSNFLPTKDKWAGQATGAKRRGNSHRLAQRQSFPKVSWKWYRDWSLSWTIAGTKGLVEQQRQCHVEQNFLKMKLRTTHTVLEEALSAVKRCTLQIQPSL